jgi:proteasome accessory factor C
MTGPSDRLTRLFALVPYLQNHQGIPLQEVAEQFGVSAAQIHKDIETLWVTGTADEHGSLIDFDYSALEEEGLVYIRDAEFLPRPLRLALTEALALVLGLRTLRETADPEQVVVIDRALAKLEHAVGEAAQAPVDIHLEQIDPAIQSTIRRALDEGQRLEIDYAAGSRDERTIRKIDPLRAFATNGRQYLEAWCLREQDVRIFRLDRMLGVTLTGEPAETREAEPRDLAADLFESEDAPYGVFDLEPRAHWMVEYYHGAEAETRGDVIRTKIIGADRDWLVRFGLRYAGIVRIVEPAELADEVAAAARSALSAYDGSNGTTEE